MGGFGSSRRQKGIDLGRKRKKDRERKAYIIAKMARQLAKRKEAIKISIEV